MVVISVWQSKTNKKGSKPYSLIMQSDGNLVAYGTGNPSVIWASNTTGKGTGPYVAAITTDCKLSVSDSNGSVKWSSK